MRTTMGADTPRLPRRVHVHLDGLLTSLDRDLARVREGQRDEALHDARVAARKLREGFAVYAACIPSGRGRRARDLLREIGRDLGRARDHEATLALLERFKQAQPREDVVWVVTRAHRLHAAAQRRAVASLDALERDGWKRRVRRALDDAREGPRSPRTVRRAAVDVVRARLTTFLARGAAIETPGSVAGLHALRRAARRLRYALDLVRRELDGAEALASELRRLQDTLGEVHDCDVVAQMLRALARRDGLTAAQRRGALALLDATERTREDAWAATHAAWHASAESHLAVRVESLLGAAA